MNSQDNMHRGSMVERRGANAFFQKPKGYCLSSVAALIISVAAPPRALSPRFFILGKSLPHTLRQPLVKNCTTPFPAPAWPRKARAINDPLLSHLHVVVQPPTGEAQPAFFIESASKKCTKIQSWVKMCSATGFLLCDREERNVFAMNKEVWFRNRIYRYARAFRIADEIHHTEGGAYELGIRPAHFRDMSLDRRKHMTCATAYFIAYQGRWPTSLTYLSGGLLY
ncbi:hypothetical protein RND71_005646 [Anisodus tanguticus]|uniref:Uncharacterized protein n=1 Tax=Anisodus tanguticus TaxID=243964 RepID=A0AAE1SQG6_9SOLA|nr:hypothetical protein RND71_005646 [Anisodus tanguticus]